MTPINLQTSGPFYFIDRAKDLAKEIGELRHGFTQSEKQEIEKTAWKNLPKLGGMIAAIAGGILLKRTSWGLAAQLLIPMVTGTATGTLAQVGLTGLLHGFGQQGFGDLLLASANDAFGASMSISVARGVTTGLRGLAAKTGWKFFLNSLFRGIVVGEAIGGTHALKNRDKTYGIEDVIISGMTGAVGGAWAPYVDKRLALELLLEIPREFGENILQAKFDRFSDGDLTIQNVTQSFVLSFAELGGSIKGHTGGMEARDDSRLTTHDSPTTNHHPLYTKQWRSPAEVEAMWGLGGRGWGIGDSGLLSREDERSGGHEGQKIPWRVLAQARAQRDQGPTPLAAHDAMFVGTPRVRSNGDAPEGMQLISTFGEVFQGPFFEWAITSHRHNGDTGRKNLANALCAEIEHGNAVDAFTMLHQQMTREQLADYNFMTQVFLPILEEKARRMRGDAHFPDMFLRVIEVCENPEIHPMLRMLALHSTEILIERNWDNLRTFPDAEQARSRVVNCFIGLARSSHPPLWKMAAQILWENETLMASAVERFAENPLPLRTVYYMYTELEAGMALFPLSGMSAGRINLEMRCLVRILDGYVARMEQALNNNDQDPHMSVADLFKGLEWLINECYIVRIARYEAYLTDEVVEFARAFVGRFSVLSQRIVALRVTGVRYDRPAWPAEVGVGTFRTLGTPLRSRLVQAAFGCVMQARTGSVYDPLANVHVDAYVLEELQQILASRTPGTPTTQLQHEGFKIVDHDLGLQVPITFLNWIEDNRHYLNIFLYPREFCYFLENHPEDFVRMRGWLKALAQIEPTIVMKDVDLLKEQAQSFLALTDLGLDLYRVMVGELPLVLAADVNNPEIGFTRVSLGTPDIIVERGRAAIAKIGINAQAQLLGMCRQLTEVATILVNSRGSKNAGRAWMDVVEAHLESVWSFYHPPEGSLLLDGERADPTIVTGAFRLVASKLNAYALAVRRNRFEWAQVEADHFFELAEKYGAPQRVRRRGWGDNGPAEA